MRQRRKGIRHSYVCLAYLEFSNQDDNNDLLDIGLLKTLWLVTRGYGLSQPSAVQLDVPKSVERPPTHTWFLNIHPPLGFDSALLCYKRDVTFVTEETGNKYPSTVKVHNPASTITVPPTYTIRKGLIHPIYHTCFSHAWSRPLRR